MLAWKKNYFLLVTFRQALPCFVKGSRECLWVCSLWEFLPERLIATRVMITKARSPGQNPSSSLYVTHASAFCRSLISI